MNRHQLNCPISKVIHGNTYLFKVLLEYELCPREHISYIVSCGFKNYIIVIILNIVDGMEDECTSQASSPRCAERKLHIVGKDYYKLYWVTEDCQLAEFTKNIPGLMHRCKLGYGFYEFTKPEYISFDKQVILMDKVFSN